MGLRSPLLALSRAEYDAINAVNWSTAKYALDSAKHYKSVCDHPREQTDSMLVGGVVHAAVFEPERMGQYAVWDLGRRAGKEWDQFQAAHEGLPIITKEQLLGALAVAHAVDAYPPAKRLLKAKGQAEATILWTDPDSGLKCKARLDWVTARCAVELKTTKDIASRAFGRQCAAMGYHGQLGMYNLGLLANGLKRRWRIVAVENQPPFDVAVYTVSEDDLYAGEEAAKTALATVAEARRKRRYPGRYGTAQPLNLPPWCWPEDYASQEAQRLALEGLI